MGPRLWGLLFRSLWMSLAATAVALALSLPWAFLTTLSPGRATRPIATGLPIFVLLCPPMVYSFGWDRVLPVAVGPYLRCLLVWSLWTFPISAWIVGTGWSRRARAVYQAALLSTSPFRAFLHAALPSLRRELILSALVIWTLLFGDYGVPHACGLVVYATELFNRAWDTRSLADVVVASWPGCLGMAVMLGLAAMEARRAVEDPEPGNVPVSGTAGTWWIVGVTAVVAVGAPLSGLLLRMGDARAFSRAWQEYGWDLSASLGVALLAGMLSVVLGLGTIGRGKTGAVVAALTALSGAMPGALIGSLLIAAFNHAAFECLYGQWPMVLLGYVVRFGWIGVLAAALSNSMRRSAIAEQAQVDGMDARDLPVRLLLRLHAPLLLAAVAVVAVLSLAEIPCTSLLLSPSYKPIAYVLIEKFHKFEDGLLVALSLSLMAPALPAAASVWMAVRRQS